MQVNLTPPLPMKKTCLEKLKTALKIIAAENICNFMMNQANYAELMIECAGITISEGTLKV